MPDRGEEGEIGSGQAAPARTSPLGLKCYFLPLAFLRPSSLFWLLSWRPSWLELSSWLRPFLGGRLLRRLCHGLLNGGLLARRFLDGCLFRWAFLAGAFLAAAFLPERLLRPAGAGFGGAAAFFTGFFCGGASASRRKGRWSGSGVNRYGSRFSEFVFVFILWTIFADFGNYVDLFFLISEIVEVVISGEAQAINHYSCLLLG